MSNSVEQQNAYDKLSRLKVGALFMRMGTGKTKVALDLIKSKSDRVNYVLWVCPCSLKSEIESERRKWAYDLNVDIVGVESIGSSDRIYMECLENVKINNTFLVVDESLKIKNLNAKRTQRLLIMSDFAKYKLILNGTPMSRSVLDMWAQMEFLSPKILNLNFREFKDRYCEYYTRGKLKGKIRRSVNIPHLVSVIEPYIFDAELDISTRKEYVAVPYCTDLDKYEETKEALFDQYYDNFEDDLNFNAFCMMLQKWYTKNSNRQEVINNLIDKLDGQVLVFVRYLQGIPQGVHAITGDVNQNDRNILISRFRLGDFKELYITYGCGAFGLNMQFCHNTIFADKVWDYALVEQAEGRTYRMGQGDVARYYNMYCSDIGLEDLFDQCISRKSGLLNTMKIAIQNTKGGIKEWVKSI